ncbi:long-chain-fatty-acid--CoA ligase [Ferroacidibacillus organovorans]|uniref:O-succinylbenzoate--CoA ligase n=2 Tax=Ferroacidibacillus organovorans TaxID=1765683 RepID=A0A1V4ESE7_9BACL|nr:long-chain-fatty-acid--CoA ligase [Ferroacidibacillus organovorans]OPG15863.1 o-succinylbenzoate--CoA ligase [Ferroacidibacillus organovorans]
MKTPLTPLDWKRRAVSLYPTKIAVVDGDRSFTYREFDERTWRLSHALRARGHGEQHVAALLYNTHEMLECFYGVGQMGGVLVPINTRLNLEEIFYILEHSEAEAIIFDADFLPMIRTLAQRLPKIQTYIVVGDESGQRLRDAPSGAPEYQGWVPYELLLANADATPFACELDEDLPLTINYTSGTTSRPKGVVLTHRNNYINAADVLFHMRVHHDDVYLHTLPMFHVNGWGSVWVFTAVGATHVCLRRVDPDVILSLFENLGITVAFGAPTVINMLLNAASLPERKLTKTIRFATAGSPPPAAVIEQAERLLKMDITHVYGLTETTPLITYCEWVDAFAKLSEEETANVKARQGVEMVFSGETRVFRSDGVDVAWDGIEIGEIAARGNTVMEGYYKQPEETAKVIRGGYFYTGDLAVVHPNGYIQIVDRAKDVIISGGENVSSVEVEGVLYQHPAILEAGVVAVPHEKWGEVPKAFVVLKSGVTVSSDELNVWCRERLAHFKTPKEYAFVDALPRTSTGKLQKYRLRQR